MNLEKIFHLAITIFVILWIVKEMISAIKGHIKFRAKVKAYRAKKKEDDGVTINW